MCAGCYGDTHPGRDPVRIVDSEPERCCRCGEQTSEGIWVRIDPALVAFPADEEQG